MTEVIASKARDRAIDSQFRASLRTDLLARAESKITERAESVLTPLTELQQRFSQVVDALPTKQAEVAAHTELIAAVLELGKDAATFESKLPTLFAANRKNSKFLSEDTRRLLSDVIACEEFPGQQKLIEVKLTLTQRRTALLEGVRSLVKAAGLSLFNQIDSTEREGKLTDWQKNVKLMKVELHFDPRATINTRIDVDNPDSINLVKGSCEAALRKIDELKREVNLAINQHKTALMAASDSYLARVSGSALRGRSWAEVQSLWNKAAIETAPKLTTTDLLMLQVERKCCGESLAWPTKPSAKDLCAAAQQLIIAPGKGGFDNGHGLVLLDVIVETLGIPESLAKIIEIYRPLGLAQEVMQALEEKERAISEDRKLLAKLKDLQMDQLANLLSRYCGKMMVRMALSVREAAATAGDLDLLHDLIDRRISLASRRLHEELRETEMKLAGCEANIKEKGDEIWLQFSQLTEDASVTRDQFIDSLRTLRDAGQLGQVKQFVDKRYQQLIEGYDRVRAESTPGQSEPEVSASAPEAASNGVATVRKVSLTYPSKRLQWWSTMSEPVRLLRNDAKSKAMLADPEISEDVAYALIDIYLKGWRRGLSGLPLRHISNNAKFLARNSSDEIVAELLEYGANKAVGIFRKPNRNMYERIIHASEVRLPKWSEFLAAAGSLESALTRDGVKLG